MFTIVIGLFVTGTAIVFAIRLALSAEPEPDKPAMPMSVADRGDRGRPASVSPAGRKYPRPPKATLDDSDRTSALRRVRSGVLLILILTALGALAALLIVLCGAILLSGLRSAVQ